MRKIILKILISERCNFKRSLYQACNFHSVCTLFTKQRYNEKLLNSIVVGVGNFSIQIGNHKYRGTWAINNREPPSSRFVQFFFQSSFFPALLFPLPRNHFCLPVSVNQIFKTRGDIIVNK